MMNIPEKKSILIVNDVTGYGRVSSFCMMPILSAYGLHPYVLPTALVSNTMDYGSSVILDTTEFMRSTVNKWTDYGFDFSVISTGFVNSSEQIDIICSLIDRSDHPFVVVDPIMADSGELYPGMCVNAVENYRKLISKSDVIIPNFTEATMLAEMYTDSSVLTSGQYEQLISGLRDLGAHNIVITGCTDSEGSYFNLVYDHDENSTYVLPFDRIPVSLIGTGDAFSASLLSELMSGKQLKEAVTAASDLVRSIALDNTNADDPYDIRIESALKRIIKDNN